MEAARRASLAEEEARQMRAEELVAGASRSRTVEIAAGTADSVVDAEDTTEGVQITEVVGSGNRTHQLANRRPFAPKVCFTYYSRISFFSALWTPAYLFGWGGVNGQRVLG